MVNNIAKVYDGKQIKEKNERKTAYTLDVDTLQTSYKL